MLLGALRGRRRFPASISSIALLKAGAIGDTVLLSAAVGDLRRAFPHAWLVLFSAESNYEIGRMLGGVSEVFRVPISNPVAALRILRSVPVDVILDFGQWSRAEALFSLASKSAFTAGFQTTAQYRHYGYDIAVEHSAEVHELETTVRWCGRWVCKQTACLILKPLRLIHWLKEATWSVIFGQEGSTATLRSGH